MRSASYPSSNEIDVSPWILSSVSLLTSVPVSCLIRTAVSTASLLSTTPAGTVTSPVIAVSGFGFRTTGTSRLTFGPPVMAGTGSVVGPLLVAVDDGGQDGIGVRGVDPGVVVRHVERDRQRRDGVDPLLADDAAGVGRRRLVDEDHDRRRVARERHRLRGRDRARQARDGGQGPAHERERRQHDDRDGHRDCKGSLHENGPPVGRERPRCRPGHGDVSSRMRGSGPMAQCPPSLANRSESRPWRRHADWQGSPARARRRRDRLTVPAIRSRTSASCSAPSCSRRSRG